MSVGEDMFDWMKVLGSQIRGWVSMRDVDKDFSEELGAHLELLTEEYIHGGMTPEEARRAARLKLGGVTQLRETNRELRGMPILETTLRDIRYAWRTLRKSPGFAIVCVLTLALGIGANTAIFNVVRATLLQSLPIREGNRLVVIWVNNLDHGWSRVGPTGQDYLDWREQISLLKICSCLSTVLEP